MLEETMRDQIRFCAFCPNVCRFSYPTSGLPQRESMAPSAIAYLAHAVINGFLEADGEVISTLSRLEGCEACRSACPYHYDIPGSVRTLLKDLAW